MTVAIHVKINDKTEVRKYSELNVVSALERAPVRLLIGLIFTGSFCNSLVI
jgi:hypothetical protein